MSYFLVPVLGIIMSKNVNLIRRDTVVRKDDNRVSRKEILY